MTVFALAWYGTLFWRFCEDSSARLLGVFVVASLLIALRTQYGSRKFFSFVLLGIVCGFLRAHLVEDLDLSADQQTVQLERKYPFGWSARIHGETLFLQQPDFRQEPQPGDWFRCRAAVEVRPPLRNPFGVVHWPGMNTARLRMPVPACERISRASLIHRTIEAWRVRVNAALQTSLTPRSRGLGLALVLGDTSAVEDEDRRIVRDSTTAHLIAVSGMHVVLVCGFLVAGLRRLLLFTSWARYRDVRRIAWGVGTCLAPVYALFSGASMSALRGAAMVGISWFCLAFARQLSPARAIAWSVVLCTGYLPRSAIDLGFALSIAATAALVVAGVQGEASFEAFVEDAAGSPRTKRIITALKSLLRVSAYAQLATVPITLWAFQSFSPLGLLANLLITPTLGVLLVPAANLHALLSLFAPAPFLRASAMAIDWLLRAYLSAAAFFADAWCLPMSGVAICAVVAGAMALFQARCKLAVAALLLLGVEEARVRRAPREGVEITLLDVGQGDAAMLRFANGRTIWIDAGPGTRESDAEIREALGTHRTSRIDVLVLTHGHPDHFAGVFALLQQAHIAEVWWNGGDPKDPLSETQPSYSRLIGMLRKRGTRFVDGSTRCRETVREGEVQLRWLAPCHYDFAESENDNSVVLEVRLGARTALFSGDVEARAERALQWDLPQGVALLKVPHHGSRTSSTSAFVERTRPQLAFVGAGYGNSFGHPNPGVVERLSQFGRVWNSAEKGGLQLIWSDSNGPAPGPEPAAFSRTCATGDVLQTRPQ